MKKLVALLLLVGMLLSLLSCGADAAPAVAETADRAPTEAATEAQAVAETPQETVETIQSPVSAEKMFLKVSAVTFSLVGESEDIYLGLIPRELVTWESEDPEVVSVDNGVLTANAVGTTTIRASYGDQQLECTAGCLAQTQEELDGLGFDILNQPKRLLPEVDLEEPCTYFDNAVLVGDSISYMMMQCEAKGDYLGGILFFARGGTSLNGFVVQDKNIFFKGKELTLEDAIAASQVERMYILIGSNDLAVPANREHFMGNWDILLGRIREKSPDVEIVVISNIPQYANEQGQTGMFREYNTNVAEYNEKMRVYAAENDCMYLDLCCYIEDHCGRMAKEYNLDGYHLNDAGYHTWMKVLRYYAQYELEGGTLS